MSAKLNWLTQNTSPGSIVLQSWLTKHDFSPQLAQKYVKNGALVKLRAGVYARPGKVPQWFNAVSCLIEQANFPIHLAGLSSLNHQGKAHYLPLNETIVWLETPPRKVLPRWFREFPDDSKHYELEPVNQGRSANDVTKPNWLLINSNKLNTDDSPYLVEITVSGTLLKASNPELAAYELLNAVPASISFDHAAEVYQGLTNLRPKKVQSILESSDSVKTNRLYLFLATYYQHPWLSRIDESKINLGTGKRQIVTEGKLEHKYQITIPKTFI